jgi:hypothetical protein
MLIDTLVKGVNIITHYIDMGFTECNFMFMVFNINFIMVIQVFKVVIVIVLHLFL